MTSGGELPDLPDPTDRAAAWSGEIPAYLAWWRALTGRSDVYHQVRTHGLTDEYAEAVPSVEALDVLADLAPVLEVGAGLGYWARLLRDRGVDVVAVDPGRWHRRSTQPWTDVATGTHRAVVEHPDRTPFVCWPPRPSGFATDVVRLAPQRTLALITVGPMNPTETPDPLYAALEHGRWRQARRVSIPTWPSRGDHLTIWKR